MGARRTFSPNASATRMPATMEHSVACPGPTIGSVWRVYKKAASAAGIGTLGTHSLRHTYRSLLDSVGTPLAVQRKLMRHADIRTTMNVYGDVITNQESEALAKIARLALANSTQTARGTA